MRRRFGRRGRRSEEGTRPTIEASWLAKIVDAGLVPVPSLEPVDDEDVPRSLALLGRGESASGERHLVSVAPDSATEALLGALVASAREGSRGGTPPVVSALAYHWDAADRRLLGALAVEGVRAQTLPGRLVEPARAAPRLHEPAQAGAGLREPRARRTFAAALAALEGLAAKHGAGLRGVDGGAELVVLASTLATLRGDDAGTPGGVVLEIRLPARSRHPLQEGNLVETLDRLEGSIRKRLNERRVRDGVEGLRARAIPLLADAAELAFVRSWPFAGEGGAGLDLLGVTDRGVPVLGAAREALGLDELAGILRAAAEVEPLVSPLLRGAPAAVCVGAPQLLLAAARFDPAVDVVLARLRLPLRAFELQGDRLAERSIEAAATRAPGRPARREPARQPEPAVEVEVEEEEEDASLEAAPSRRDEGEEAGSDGAGRNRRRRRRGGRGRRRPEGGEGEVGAVETSREEVARDETAREEIARDEPGPRAFLELSAFDLDDDVSSEEANGGRRRRRRRGRGRRGGSEEGDDGGDDEGPPARRRPGADAAPAPGRAEAAGERDTDDDLEVVDEEAVLALLVPDAPEPDEGDEDLYEQADLEETPLTQAERLRLERQKRRSERIEAGSPLAAAASEAGDRAREPEPGEPRELPRGRAAILAHADRDSLVAAVLLAREVRQLEGIWIYPQRDLMTFFRGVATDLRGNAPIYVVGFEPRPAHDALQAASLYRDRLVWFDHHEWPPEDLHAMREAIGADMVHVAQGTESSLSSVLALCERRSRFSDKLVDLATGRFSEHDWDRWGRLWWHRLGELAGKTGEHRADLDLLISGRPSDLAKEAALVSTPPPPPEAEFAASRDFRLVHFGGHALVVAEVPEGVEIGLSARILRERYGAPISLARRTGSGVCVLGSDDQGARRALDVGAMADHLATKFEWVDGLPDGDHVARFRVRDLEHHPDRFEEVVSEIAMGRSTLEG